MRKLLVLLLTLFMVGASATFAQEQQGQDNDVEVEDLAVSAEADALGTTSYAGASLGLPLLQGYYGLENGFAGGDLRFRLALQPFFGFGISGGADLLFDLSRFGDDNEFTLYAGGGPSLNYFGRNFGDADLGYSLFGFDVTGVGGVNYRLDPGISLFAETGIGFGFGLVTGSDDLIPDGEIGGLYVPIRFALGANFHF